MNDQEIFSLEEWNQIVEHRLHSKEFEIVSCEVSRLQTTGGYLGEHFTASVTVRSQTSKHSENLRFFLKAEPKCDESQREIVKQLNVFKKEVYIWNKLFEKVRSVLKKGGRDMIWTCQCYFTRPDVIVLEDLSQKGFRTFTIRDSVDYKYHCLAMKALANMHAASIIFEEMQPNQPYRLGNIYPDLLSESFFIDAPNHPGTLCVEASIKSIWLLVKLIRGKGALLRMKIELEKAIHSLFDFQKPSVRFRNVMCQGDVKRDNILCRQEGGESTDVAIVDFQLLRYTPPANDVMCFLYISSNRDFRQKFASELISTYYDQFAMNLSNYGLEPNDILPWGEFKESCDIYKTLGIVMSAVYSPVTYIKEENLRHVFTSPKDFERFFKGDRSPEITHSYKTDELYRKYVTEVIEELVEECIVKPSHQK
ncbi:hypothetical protein R5R35_005245 [Gryllus longicercus]|uniref:CHK kinase-like domain-containing protein n=1 Tax=Gryllus longicercus TaxID=2509291 RepID=A0AAN9VR05_9ORTH